MTDLAVFTENEHEKRGICIPVVAGASIRPHEAPARDDPGASDLLVCALLLCATRERLRSVDLAPTLGEETRPVRIANSRERPQTTAPSMAV